MQAFDLYAILPELVLLVATCLLLVASVFVRENVRSTPGVEQDIFHTPRGVGFVYFFSILLLIYLIFAFVGRMADPALVAMNGLFQSDPFSNLLKACSCIAVLVSLIYSKQYLMDRALFRPDFIVLALLALLGQFVLISGANLLTLYLGLELMALPTYALVAMRHTSEKSVEAGIKYFILGALASGFLLYGMSMLYGVTGSLDLIEIFKTVADPRVNHLVMAFGLVFIVAGLAFKLGVVPFHMWVPDVYQGAPTPITAFMAACTKVAAFGAILRIFYVGFADAQSLWQPIISVIAIITMIFGSVVAIAQRDVKRMLAYSSIAHAGFLLLGVVSLSKEGLAASLFYLFAYGFTTIAAFGIISLVRDSTGEVSDLNRWIGLGKKSPLVASVFSFLLLSFAGIPLTSGFIGKFAIFSAAYQSANISLVVVGVLASAVAAFFYIRVIIMIFFTDPVNDSVSVIIPSIRSRIAIVCATLVSLVLGIFPSILLNASNSFANLIR